MIKRTVRTYVGIEMLIRFGSTSIAATYTLYLMNKGNLDLFQISLVNFVFFTTMFFAEIPTGAFADTYGRKLSFLIACGLSTTGCLIYALSSTFGGFALAEFLAALGCTFCSGAFQAWLKDNLAYHGYDGDIGVIFARQNQLCNVAGAVASVTGAYIATINISLPWIMSAVFMAAAGVAGLIFIKEDYLLPSSKRAKEGMTVKLGKSWQEIRLGGAVTLVMVMGIVHSLGLMAPNMQWQPYYMPYLGSKANLGWFWVGVSAAIILGSELGVRFRLGPKFERSALIVTQIFIGVVLALAGCQFPGFTLIGFYMLHEVGRGLITPLRDAYLTDSIPDEGQRATLLSCGNVTSHLGGMAGLLLSGFVARGHGIGMTWLICGCFIAAGTFLVSRLNITKNRVA